MKRRKNFFLRRFVKFFRRFIFPKRRSVFEGKKIGVYGLRKVWFLSGKCCGFQVPERWRNGVWYMETE